MCEFKGNNSGNQRGVLLLELLISMVTMTVLLAGAVSCFGMMLKIQREMTGALFLQEQVKFAAAGLVRDLTYAQSAYITANRIVIETGLTSSSAATIIYELTAGKLMKDNQPVTGNNKLQQIKVQKFVCRKLNDRIVLINIEASNLGGQQVFGIETAAVLLNYRSARSEGD